MRAATGLVFAVGLGALISTACSTVWVYEYAVSIAPGVPLDAGATLVMAQAPEAGAITQIRARKTATTSADTRDYGDRGSTCCAPKEVVSLYAFLDLDADGAWDAGEPWGADPNNPVTIENNDYVSRILVEPDPR